MHNIKKKKVTLYIGTTLLKGGLPGPSQLLFGFHDAHGFTGVKVCKNRTSSS